MFTIFFTITKNNENFGITINAYDNNYMVARNI